MAARTPITTSRQGGKFLVDYGTGLQEVRQGEYRRALAAVEGYASRSARAADVKAARQLESLTARQKSARTNVLRAISLSRETGLPVSKSGRVFGVSLDAIKKYSGDAIERRGGKWVVGDSDRLTRRMVVLTPEGPSLEIIRSSRDASLLGRYYNALKEYARTGDRSALQEFAGRSVTVRGQKVELITDPETLNNLARAGVLSDIESVSETS
jgi:hypothetical protein